MTDKQQKFNKLLDKAQEIISKTLSKKDILVDICTLLKDNVSYYDWVGFYLVDPEKERELVLGPFAGDPTEHVRIPFGKGICGQAAETKSTFIVQDVSKETNYLSCSPFVKSEIVVPFVKNGQIIGEIDIDSHQRSPFTEEDRKFLEDLCGLISIKLL